MVETQLRFAQNPFTKGYDYDDEDTEKEKFGNPHIGNMLNPDTNLIQKNKKRKYGADFDFLDEN